MTRATFTRMWLTACLALLLAWGYGCGNSNGNDEFAKLLETDKRLTGELDKYRDIIPLHEELDQTKLQLELQVDLISGLKNTQQLAPVMTFLKKELFTVYMPVELLLYNGILTLTFRLPGPGALSLLKERVRDIPGAQEIQYITPENINRNQMNEYSLVIRLQEKEGYGRQHRSKNRRVKIPPGILTGSGNTGPKSPPAPRKKVSPKKILQRKIEKKARQILRAQRTINKKRDRELLLEILAKYKIHSKLNDILPDTVDLEAEAGALEQAAAAMGVQIGNVLRSGPWNKKIYFETSYTIELNARYRNLGAFIEHLEKEKRIFAFSFLHLEFLGESHRRAPVRAKMKLSTYSYNAEAYPFNYAVIKKRVEELSRLTRSPEKNVIQTGGRTDEPGVGK